MKSNLLHSFWSFLQSDIKAIPWSQLLDTGIESVRAIESFKSGWKGQASQVDKLIPYLDQVEPFVKLLDAPLTQLAISGLPLVSLLTNLLKVYLGLNKITPTFEKSVALACQIAYLESLKSVLSKVSDPTVLEKLARVSLAEIFEKQLMELDIIELTRAEAKSTINQFCESPLVESLNQSLTNQLSLVKLSKRQIRNLVEQVAWGTPRYLHLTISELKENVQPLADFLRVNGPEAQEKYESIETYLKHHIDPLPDQAIFDEPDCVLKDLYIELDVQPLDSEGYPLARKTTRDTSKFAKPLNIHTWVNGILESPTKKRQLIFIEGDTGRGKSVFCRMLAKSVRDQLYPAFIPILICLRDVQKIENNLSKTLESFLEFADFVQSDSGWLTDKNTRFLFIFDGFDELLLEGRTGGGLKDFLQQVNHFQNHNFHQCLVTGRPLALQGIDRQITQIRNLKRARIEPMQLTHQERWLSQWGQKFGLKAADSLQIFLENCPQAISHSLAREPLLLYLIGRLYREGQLSQTLFDADSQDHLVMIQIYDQAISWVLEKQRQDENIRLAGLGVEDLRNILREAALCVVQSGGETAKLSMLEARLTDQENPISNLFKQARTSIAQDTQKTLNNLLTTFYLKPHEGDKTGSIEFAHKSFEEFLFAERLYNACEDWTCLDRKGKRLDVSDQQMDWQLYDLLGYGALTPEILKYLQVWLCENSDFNLATLFTRLQRFYLHWSEGGYIDNNPERNLPQRKMLQLQTLEAVLGLRRVDINTGLNVMLLLFELHAHGQSLSKHQPLRQHLNFQPCGDFNQPDFDKEKLKRVMAYSSLINRHEFIERVGFTLRMANLSQVNLNDSCLMKANLQQANLANANLNNTDLSGSNLSGANLSGAKLAFTKLIKANLSAANLSRADLYNAQLFGVTLTQGNLNRAKMAGVKLVKANLSSAQARAAKLAEADLSKATLIGTDFSRADLYKVNFYQADLENANLENANLFRANLSKANLKGIRWNKNTRFIDIKGWENAQNVPLQIQKILIKADQEERLVQQSIATF